MTTNIIYTITPEKAIEYLTKHGWIKSADEEHLPYHRYEKSNDSDKQVFVPKEKEDNRGYRSIVYDLVYELSGDMKKPIWVIADEIMNDPRERLEQQASFYKKILAVMVAFEVVNDEQDNVLIKADVKEKIKALKTSKEFQELGAKYSEFRLSAVDPNRGKR